MITLLFNSMLQGYHEYQMIWNNPIVGEELVCNRELGNIHDPYAVAAKKNNQCGIKSSWSHP